MLGSLPINGVPTSPQQGDVLLLPSHVPAAVSMPSLDAPPSSPRLSGSAALPQTPPSQLLRTVSSPPPVRRLRKIASCPPASHPILSSAITVACTQAPEAGRPPTQRQLAFPILSSLPVQRGSPFAAAATVPAPATLLDKINSLPGPQQLLRSVLTENKASLSLQDSGMLTHMLHRATLFPTGDEGSGGASVSAGSACSVSAEDAASHMRSKSPRISAAPMKAPAPAVRAPAPAVRGPAPPVSRFCVDRARVSSLLSSSRSAFSNTALKRNGYASRFQRTAYAAPAPSADPRSSPQGFPRGSSMRTQGRAVLQQAANVPITPPADSFFSYSSAGPDCTQPGPVPCPRQSSATGLTHTVPKGRLCSATARLDTPEKPFCPVPDHSDLSNKDGKVDADHQAVRATEYSPRGCVSWDPAGFTDGTDHVSSPTARLGLFPNAMLAGAVSGATRSSPSDCKTGQDLLTTPADIGSAHTRTTISEMLRPPPSDSFSLANAIDRGRASLSEAPDSRASHKGLPGWCPPQGTSKFRPGFSSHADLECRLTLPRGTRGHKRPRLEDKLKEQRMLRAEFGGRSPHGGIQ